jgi:hypothetical protein
MAASTISNAAAVTFPQCTGGTESATHFAIGTVSSGAINSKILHSSALDAPLAISNGITPEFAIGALTVLGGSEGSDWFNTKILDLIYRNAANILPYIGDANGPQPSATAGSLYVSLHTADPGAGGDQTTNECAYTSYARVAVARSNAGWNLA